MLHAQNTLSKLRFEEILHELSNLQLADLEQFVQKATQLLEQRRLPQFSNREEELIYQIKNNGPSKAFWKEYDILAAKLEQETIDDKERLLFLEQVEISEKWSVERLKLILELSQLWECSAEDVLKRLNIKPRVKKYA
ncbi:MAG: hypothetical protein AAGG68_30765 [Bacteroidota bacterium]